MGTNLPLVGRGTDSSEGMVKRDAANGKNMLIYIPCRIIHPVRTKTERIWTSARC